MTTRPSRVRRFFLSALLFATLAVAGSSAEAAGFGYGYKGYKSKAYGGYKLNKYAAKKYGYNKGYYGSRYNSYGKYLDYPTAFRSNFYGAYGHRRY